MIRWSHVGVSILFLLGPWLFTVLLQVGGVAMTVYGLFYSIPFLGLGAMSILCSIGLTFPFGGVFVLPGLFVRFKRSVETRVVKYEDGDYALYVKAFGRWWIVNADDDEWVHIAMFPEWSVGEYYVSERAIRRYESNFQHYLQLGFNQISQGESIRRSTYVRGEKQ